MTEAYTPATVSAADLEALRGRLDRYLNRHGSRYGETPIPADQKDDVAQSILAEWWGDDWTAREMESLARHGRTLFAPTLSELGQHLRALLFHAGRARRRGWRAAGATERVADKRRDPEGSKGAGAGSVTGDPARLVAAVESATGELVLSKEASRHRSRRGMPLKYRPGLPIVSSRAPTAFKVMKRRNATGYTVDVVARHEDRTAIEIRKWVRYNFERVGQVPRRVEDNAHYVPTMGIGRVVRSKPNPARRPARKPLPEGTTVADVRTAIGLTE
jgi:hypothetical protein